MSSGFLAKDKLVYDPANPSDGDNLGAFIRGADGTLITHTTVGGKEALDVNVANTVDVNVTNSLTISGSYAEDSAHTSGDIGLFTLAVRKDVEGSLASADGDYAPLQVDDQGRLRVAAEISVATGSDKSEDAVHVSGDIGAYVLAVRSDIPSIATSASGDYASMTTDSHNRQWVNDSRNIEMLNAATTVGTTAVNLVASALAGRKEIMIQNRGNKDIFIGSSNAVTTANGFRIAGGATFGVSVGPNIAVWAISGTAGQDVRLLEFA